MRKKRVVPSSPVPSWEEWVSSAPVAGRTGMKVASDPSLHKAVARLAYSYWEARGFQGGSAEEDWLRAEAELQLAVIRS